MRSIRNSLVFGAVLGALIMVSRWHQMAHWPQQSIAWSYAVLALLLAAAFLPFAIAGGRRERRRQQSTRTRRTEGHPRNGRRASADGYTPAGR